MKNDALSSDASGKHTYFSFGVGRLSALWRAVMRTECPGDVRELFATMLSPWGDSPLPATPAWHSDITDDHTPFEFSVAFSRGRQELRILVEAQGARPTLASTMAAGVELNRVLAAKGADLGRFDAVADLFLPQAPMGKFALWHAAAVAPGQAPTFRVYLNPQVAGAERSHAVVEEALGRLGLKDAFSTLAAAARRGPELDEFRYFSLDLSADGRARVKVYVYHHEATVDDLERTYALAGNHEPGAVAEFCSSIAATQGRLSMPPGTCFAFVQGEKAATATLHLPVRFYTENDREARARLRGYFARRNVPVEPYDQALEAVSGRALEAGSGLQTYASLRMEPKGPRVTVYFATEAFQTVPVRAPAALPATQKPEAIVEHYERQSIAQHPFLQRLRREPQNPGALWLVMMNVREGVSRHFSRRLANVLARTENLGICSILARQLNDELGNGDATRAHIVLFDRLLEGLEPLKPAVLPDDMLAPGRELDRRLDALYLNRDALEGVGAAIVIEIIGKQADCFIADEFRRQEVAPKAALEWLSLHEVLEETHSAESLELAGFVPPDEVSRAAVWRGARECGAAMWAFVDGLYNLCFGAGAERRG